MKKFLLSATAGLFALSLFVASPVVAQDDVLDTTYDWDYDYDYSYDSDLSDEDVALIAGFGLLMFGVLGVVGLGVYIYMAMALMTIGKKVDFDKPWMAWVPIVNLYMMLKLADQSGWILILAFIPFLNFFFMLFMIYVWMKIAEKRGFESWVGILMIVPVVGIAVPGYIAWAEPKATDKK